MIITSKFENVKVENKNLIISGSVQDSGLHVIPHGSTPYVGMTSKKHGGHDTLEMCMSKAFLSQIRHCQVLP